VHRHPTLAFISAILVTACNQPLQPRVNLADPLFAATAASEYQALDLGRFLPAAINSRGDVAGVVGIGRSQHAVVWRNGVLQDLGTLPPEFPDDPDAYFFSVVTAMNSRGQIVGWESFFPPFEDVRAFVWDNGVLRDLNTPGGCCGGRNIAEAINEAGHITGVTGAFGPLHAFLWRTGTMTDLGTLGGSTELRPRRERQPSGRGLERLRPEQPGRACFSVDEWGDAGPRHARGTNREPGTEDQ